MYILKGIIHSKIMKKAFGPIIMLSAARLINSISGNKRHRILAETDIARHDVALVRHHKTEPVIQILKTCSIEFEVFNYKAYNPISLSHYLYDSSGYEVHTIVATFAAQTQGSTDECT